MKKECPRSPDIDQMVKFHFKCITLQLNFIKFLFKEIMTFLQSKEDAAPTAKVVPSAYETILFSILFHMSSVEHQRPLM